MIKQLEKPTQEANSSLSIGSIAEGVVVGRDRSSLFLDLGVNGNGIIYGREFYDAKETIKNLNIGDKLFVKVVDLENEDGYKELSLREATKQMGWQNLIDIKENGEIIKVKVTGVNKGGLLTSVQGIAAFLPVSQLSPEHYPRVAEADKQKILKELQKFVGQTLEVKILDLAIDENKLILSEKAKSEEKTKEFLKNYKAGDIINGEVSGIANFGVFIKFPAGEKEASSQIEGLIHISELDWQLIENPADLVKIGDEVKAQIIEIRNSQVFLSLKSLKKNPWEDIEKKYKKGDTIKGKVTKLNPFGAFIQVEDKIQGLCHISEFESLTKMEESLKVGETYEFQVSSVEPKEYRMSLKLVK
ncbi:MAG: S1 RNA-binding domain-containing protein [Candidatus Staskawiczbacteria bacterium]|jgi:small subunit ribosomal protein S1